MPPASTERLRLRELKPADLDAMALLLRSRNPVRLAKWLRTREDTEWWIEFAGDCGRTTSAPTRSAITERCWTPSPSTSAWSRSIPTGSPVSSCPTPAFPGRRPHAGGVVAIPGSGGDLAPLDVGRFVAAGCRRGCPTRRGPGTTRPSPTSATWPVPERSRAWCPTPLTTRPPPLSGPPGSRSPVSTAPSCAPSATATRSRQVASRWMRDRIPGTQGVEHVAIRDAGHFVQEDAGPELAEAVIRFVRTTCRALNVGARAFDVQCSSHGGTVKTMASTVAKPRPR